MRLARAPARCRYRTSEGRLDRRGDSLPALANALLSARDGRTPLVANGLPDLPAWAERRQSQRFTLNSLAVMTANGRQVQVLVANVSRQGMGLDMVTGVTPGQMVSIELSIGRKFIGTVIWCEGKRAGLTLRRPLSPCDPMLGG